MRKRENEYQLDPFKLFENNEIAQKINEAIEQLPPQQKKIYILHNRKGHSLEKIAQELDLSIFTIRNHLAKANNKLRKILSSSYPELFAYSLFVISQFTFF